MKELKEKIEFNGVFDAIIADGSTANIINEFATKAHDPISLINQGYEKLPPSFSGRFFGFIFFVVQFMDVFFLQSRYIQCFFFGCNCTKKSGKYPIMVRKKVH
jgi:hypothetical protein